MSDSEEIIKMLTDKDEKLDEIIELLYFIKYKYPEILKEFNKVRYV